MNILVTGGAGYIGSHMVYALLDKGFNVHVIDNLSTGNVSILPSNIGFTECDIQNTETISNLINKKKFAAVVHFAASISVYESTQKPMKYFKNNISNSIVFLDNCIKNNIKNFLFSSTAAVYGNPKDKIISENQFKNPISIYGETKLIVEKILQSLSSVHNINYGILRYFNVAGADPKKRTGQLTDNATHLIKVACETALGYRPKMEIYGNDYNTNDGTAIRDFIHVTDLIEAHILLLSKMIKSNKSFVFNCGYGKGYSVQEVINSVKKISNNDFKTVISQKRKGDPDILVADNDKLKKELLWRPKFNDIDKIVSHSLEWEKTSRKNNFKKNIKILNDS